jgi:hypothetical protein
MVPKQFISPPIAFPGCTLTSYHTNKAVREPKPWRSRGSPVHSDVFFAPRVKV